MTYESTPAHLAIFGATRGIGRALLDLAVEAGHPVTVLARDPSKLAGLDPARVRVVTGDTREFHWGTGTFASRGAVVAGNACHAAAVAVRKKILKLAGDELDQAAEGRIGCQRAQQWLRCSKLIGQLVEIVETQIEETVAGEERVAGGEVDGPEMLAVGPQPGGEFGCCLLDTLRRGAVDHHDDRVVELGESTLESEVVLTEGNLGGDHFRRIGIDAEMGEGVTEGERRGQDGQDDDQPRSGDHVIDPPSECCSESDAQQMTDHEDMRQRVRPVFHRRVLRR